MMAAPKSMAFQKSGRSPRCRTMQRQPARSSRARPEAGARGGGSGSGCRIRRTPRAESRKETASTAIENVAPKTLTSSPPTGGPALMLSQSVDSNRAAALSRSPGATSPLRCAVLAAPKAIAAAACTMPTRHNWTKLSTPRAAATGTLIRTANRSRSAATITGRFRRCSIRTPRGRVTAAATTADSAASRDTWDAEAPRATTATNGSAPEPIELPAALTA